MAQHLQCEERTVDGATVVALTGRLDIDTSPGLREVLLRHVKAGSAGLLVDMTGVEFIDSSGVATFIDAQLGLSTSGRGLVLFGLSPQTRDAFAMAKVTDVLTLAGDQQEALAAMVGETGTG